MLRNALLGLSILFLPLGACGDSEKPSPPSIDSSGSSEAAHEVDLEKAFPELVEKARAELNAVSGLDLADLEFKLVDEDKILDTLLANLSIQDLEQEERTRESMRPLAKSMVGIYSMDEGLVYVSLENYQWLTDVMEMPDSYTEEILFAVIAHEGAHAIADRKYGLIPFIQSCATPSELLAANSVIEGYAQMLARQVCAKTGMDSGIVGLTELITTVPEIEDPVGKMLVAVMVQQFSFSYVEGEAFLNALLAAKGQEGIDLAFSAPPTSRNIVTNPDWYLDPSKRPGSNYQFDVALDVFDEYFADKDFATQRIDFDEGLLRVAASALPPEDLEDFASAVIQSRLTLGQGGQNMVVCALHHCQDEDHAALYVKLSKQLIVAKEEMMKDTDTPITKSELQDLDEPGFSGFKIKQTIDAGALIDTQTVLIVKGDLVCEMTLIATEMPQEDMVNLAFDLLNKATSTTED